MLRSFRLGLVPGWKKRVAGEQKRGSKDVPWKRGIRRLFERDAACRSYRRL
jgi:hypothetical protein